MQTPADRPNDLPPTFDPDPTSFAPGPADYLAASRSPWLASLYLSRLDQARLRLVAWAERLRALPRRARRCQTRRCVTRGGLTRRWTAALPAALLGLALAAGGAGAGMDAGLVVAAPGGAFDGVSIAPDGLCSLREAIINANDDATTHPDCAAGSGADTISLPAGAVLTVPDAFSSSDTGSSGLPAVTSEIVIEGNAATIRRDPSNPAPFRLLHVDLGNLTLREATVTGGLTHGDGGGIFVGRNGHADAGRLRLESVTMFANATVDLGGDNINGGRGGGLFSGNGTIITDSVIRNNYADWNGAGIAVSSDAVITRSTISGNTARDQGGGIAAWNGLVIVGSTISGNSSGDDGGGGIDAGDGVRITDSTISGNTAHTGTGGGISADSDVTITRSIISGNSASFGGGVSTNEAGGLVIADSTISGNTSESGGGGIGGAYNPIIRRSTISGNTAGSDGGGIWCEQGAVISRSTISGNSAGGKGGGAYVKGDDDDKVLKVANSTISGNLARGDGGGVVGIVASTEITNSTIFGNSTGGIGGGISTRGSVQVANTIIAGQLAGADCDGAVTSLGHNIEGGTACGFAGAGDHQNISPGQLDLGALAANGGPTFTHMPNPASPARDGGDDTICAAASVGGIDQRGIARPQPSGGRCDIGAVEAMAGEPAPATPTMPASPTVPLPTATSTPRPPSATPTAAPAGPVCPQIAGRVPQAVIDAAVANPGQVRGFGELLDPGKPPGPLNPPRRWLSLRSLALPYHPLGNSVEYKASCP